MTRAIHSAESLALALLASLEKDDSGTDPVRARRHSLIARLRAGDELEITLADVGAEIATDPIVVRARLAERRDEPWFTEPQELLVCAADASWFECRGTVTMLVRRPTLRRLLGALLTELREHPGVGLTSAQLLARAWPGERFAAGSGANRLYFAIAHIRALGLRPYLRRAEDGYLLDPSAPIEIREARPERPFAPIQTRAHSPEAQRFSK